jgi:hypothetical protein
MNRPDLQQVLDDALDQVRDQLGPEQFAAAWAAAERRHRQAKRPRPAKKATGLVIPDVLPELKKRLAADEKKVAAILARRAAAAQARQKLAGIAAAARQST